MRYFASPNNTHEINSASDYVSGDWDLTKLLTIGDKILEKKQDLRLDVDVWLRELHRGPISISQDIEMGGFVVWMVSKLVICTGAK